MATSPPASDKPSVPPWLIPLASLLIGLVGGWGSFNQQKGAMEASMNAKVEAQQKVNEAQQQQIDELLTDKRNAQIKALEELETYRRENAKQLGEFANLAKQLKSSTPK